MSNKVNNDTGTTIPLYDEVKRTIYINFCEMSNAYADLVTTSNKAQKKLCMWDFRKRYILFFQQVNHPDKLNKLDAYYEDHNNKIDKSKQKYLRKCYLNLSKLNESHTHIVMQYSRELIENLGITKIEAKKKSPGSAILDFED